MSWSAGNISCDVSLILENIKKGTARQHTVVRIIKNKYSGEDDERECNDGDGDGNDGNNANAMAEHKRDVSPPTDNIRTVNIDVKNGESILLGIKNSDGRSSDEDDDMKNNDNNDNHNHNNHSNHRYHYRDRNHDNGGNNDNVNNNWGKRPFSCCSNVVTTKPTQYLPASQPLKKRKLNNGDSKNMDAIHPNDTLKKIIKIIKNGNVTGIHALNEWIQTVSQYFVSVYYNKLSFDDKSSIICMQNMLLGLPNLQETDILHLFRAYFKLVSLQNYVFSV